jgi:hypothetical protein
VSEGLSEASGPPATSLSVTDAAAQAPCSCGCGALGPKPLPLAQAALDLDQSEKTLRRWVADKAPHHKGPGRTGALTFDGAELRAWMAQTGRTGGMGPRTATERALAEAGAIGAAAATPEAKAARAAVEQLDGDGLKFLAALDGDDRTALLRLAPNADPKLVKKLEGVGRARAALADAVKRELDNQVRRRELLPASVVIAKWRGQIEVVKGHLEALPGKLAPDLVDQQYDAIYALLEAEFHALLRAFAVAELA